MKFVCQVCGYVHEGDSAPEKCPQCGAPAEKFTAQSGAMEWAAEYSGRPGSWTMRSWSMC